MDVHSTDCPLVLLAEDDQDDKELIMLAFKKLPSKYILHIADNGQEALDYLQKLSNQKLPCLIVLDLNMPVLDGYQTLKALNRKQEFRSIPKVIFTTSDSQEDRARCLSSGATDYLVKPSHMNEIVKTVETMLRYCE